MEVRTLVLPSSDYTLVSISEIIPDSELFKLLSSSFQTFDFGIYLPAELYYISADSKILSVAFVSYRPEVASYFIHNACTHKHYRRQGLLSLILQEIIENVPGPFSLEVLDQNLSARRLYEKFGFKSSYMRQGVHLYTKF